MFIQVTGDYVNEPSLDQILISITSGESTECQQLLLLIFNQLDSLRQTDKLNNQEFDLVAVGRALLVDPA
ncbi:hypothetical protein [Paenibacillus alba]|uniref:Uncharacterized protein n=1 Tax=Paenibacillus alba TaxID=1197127 RepID=A0ABU6FZE7_9BACL|nr:hypothetical protein [Paenibacillus alba]MEC0226437.1 hypothetical protein [Paenibacillus alba]